jgi:tRNA dimethylallyltransferase
MKKVKNKIVIVCGPTASGKSDLAVQIAKKYNGKVISADSRQVYTGLDIATGKITTKEMKGVPHHCLDIVNPKKSFSVADFQKKATSAIKSILEKGKLPIICGGTGFYIDAVVDGIILPEVKTNPKLRNKLEKYSTEKLLHILKKMDQKRYDNIDQNNRVRIIRSIEIAKILGKVPKIKKKSLYTPLIIGLDTEDELLKEKILKRIHKRMKAGMVTEAKRLHKEGVSWKRMRKLGLEYGLLADLLQKKISREQFIERLAFDIWHYVKRQRTWFKKDDRVVWFKPTDGRKIKSEVQNFLSC